MNASAPRCAGPGFWRQNWVSGYQVIEEGLGGRTTLWDDPIEGYKNGRDYLIPCLDTHRPIDAVVLMLGTNDLKLRFSVSAYDIAASIAVLVEIIQKSADRDREPPSAGSVDCSTSLRGADRVHRDVRGRSG